VCPLLSSELTVHKVRYTATQLLKFCYVRRVVTYGFSPFSERLFNMSIRLQKKIWIILIGWIFIHV